VKEPENNLMQKFKLKNLLTGKSFLIYDGQIIGRPSAPGVHHIETVPFDSKVSRKHFKIKIEGGRVFITDLESSNGTFLNHKLLESNKAYELNETSVINFGALVYSLIVEEVVAEKGVPEEISGEAEKIVTEVNHVQSEELPNAEFINESTQEIEMKKQVNKEIKSVSLMQKKNAKKLSKKSEKLKTPSKNKRFLAYGALALCAIAAFLFQSGDQNSFEREPSSSNPFSSYDLKEMENACLGGGPGFICFTTAIVYQNKGKSKRAREFYDQACTKGVREACAKKEK